MFWGSLYICIFSYDRFGRLTLFLGGTSFSCVIYADCSTYRFTGVITHAGCLEYIRKVGFTSAVNDRFLTD